MSSVLGVVPATEAGLVVGEDWTFVAYGFAIAPLTAGCIHRLFGAALGNELLLGCIQGFMYQIVCLLYKHKT